MFQKVLIANRGEIAVRIIRACKALGISTVAVHSLADKDSLHTKIADDSVCIGASAVQESYLKIPAIIAAAEITGAQAIHPGYGFLSEKADFVDKCNASNIVFIGPSSRNIHLMGDKIQSRITAQKAKVPIVLGSEGGVPTVEKAHKIAKEIGFPVLIKATAGGGGRGMRVVYSQGSLNKLYDIAKSEAMSSFGNDEIFIEKFIEKPRHVEVQILGDKHKNIVHIGTRDCSCQRRNQKLIEEAPAPFLKPEVIETMQDAACRLAKSIDYESLGTMEFVMDKDQNFYFIEMNTRLQVEHPVSEEISGIDLVQEQIKVAAGMPLDFSQKDIKLGGHALECRINAEDPNTFAPSPGKIDTYHTPGGFGVRIDSFVYQGYNLPAFYDSLIAKLIVKAPTRKEAIQKMLQALEEFLIEGVKTSIPLQKTIFKSLRFQEGQLETGLVSHFVDKKKTDNL
jgi:acetyl-CoA carboxylase biotin carboxylase subunit